VPLAFKVVDGQIVEEEKSLAQLDTFRDEFRRIMQQQLEHTPRNEVFLYVHGYHNTFDDAAFAMAELWHFLGRIGVPVVYTWPAGYPGMFGYTYDRESSEFTVYHLRRALKAIASIPEVEKIHLIAHSRGTDVAVNALRELTLEARGGGRDPKVEFKIHNLVLAAPDLDLQVAVQRLMGDKLAHSVHRFTIYTSPADRAIGIASRLFASPSGRLGTFGADQIQGNVKEDMDYGNANFAFVNFSGTSDAASDTYGHSYFRDAPTVSSDLVIMLRDDVDPGEPGRPLTPVARKFWRVPPGYPAAN